MDDDDKQSDVAEEQRIVGIDMGIAIPKDPTKSDYYVAVRITANEVFLSVNDAREVAMNLLECANRVEEQNNKRMEKDNGSIQ
jgi:hypothetical protein